MSYGHNFVLNNFGKIPKIGWVIDPCKKQKISFWMILLSRRLKNISGMIELWR